MELELLPIEVYIEKIGIFDLFGSCDLDLDLDPITFIHEFDPWTVEVYRMCKYKLPTSLLRDIHTDRHRQTQPKLYTTALRGWSKFMTDKVQG